MTDTEKLNVDVEVQSARERFILRVLRHFAFSDCDEVWWRCDDCYAPVTFFVNCNDLFMWACSDAQDLTPDNIGDLEKAFEDVKAIIDDGSTHSNANLLFCARLRGMRPQGAYYDAIPEALWPLFDACGEPREVNFGNPLAHPSERKSPESEGN